MVEASLSSLLFIASSLPADENLFLPQLIHFILALPDILALKITAMELIGRLARWISYNPVCLQAVLQWLINALSSPALSTCASESIMLLFKACAGMNSDLPVLGLNELMVKLRDSGSLRLSADISLLEGLCTVASAYDRDRCGATLATLIAPITQSLALQLTAPSTAQIGPIMANIDRLTAIMRSVRYKGNKDASEDPSTHPVMKAFVLIQPLCQQVMERIATEYACEKICRLYKYNIRGAGKAFNNFLPPMCAHLVTAFLQRPYSPLLYAISICVAEFGSEHNNTIGNNASDEVLYSALWSISESFFRNHSSVADFENSPDVVEEYFHLLARYLEHCPRKLVESPQLTHLVGAGLMGLQMQHKDATKGILHFFERLIGVGAADPAMCSAVDGIVAQLFGKELTRILLKSIFGEMPTYSLFESAGSLTDVFWRLKARQGQNLQVFKPASFAPLKIAFYCCIFSQ